MEGSTSYHQQRVIAKDEKPCVPWKALGTQGSHTGLYGLLWQVLELWGEIRTAGGEKFPSTTYQPDGKIGHSFKLKSKVRKHKSPQDKSL